MTSAASLHPLYFIYGDELFFVQEMADAVRAAAKKAGFLERSVFMVEPGFPWKDCLLSCRTPSLFSSKTLIEFRFVSTTLSTDAAQSIEFYTRALPKHAVTLMTAPALGKAAEKSQWFACVRESGKILKAPTMDWERLPAWLSARVKGQQQSLSDDALALLAEHVEGNLFAAHQEIQKLGLLFPPGEISLAALDTALSNLARFHVFQLSDALYRGQAQRFVRILEGLRLQSEPPTYVLWVLSDAVRTLLRLHRGRANSVPTAVLYKTLNIWPSKQKILAEALTRVSQAQLQNALQEAARIDQAIKGLSSDPVWDALRQWGLGLLETSA